MEEPYKMIPKSDLIDAKWYKGICRNAKIAMWNVKEQKFLHLSYSFGYYMDKIEHFEDVKEGRLDGFIPVEAVEYLDGFKLQDLRNTVGY